MGGRKLVQWMLKPLLNPNQIRKRLDAVEELKKSSPMLSEVREILAQVGDLERFVSKIITNRATARDLNALKNSLKTFPELKKSLGKAETTELISSRDKIISGRSP